jgi:hypothetical protein
MRLLDVHPNTGRRTLLGVLLLAVMAIAPGVGWAAAHKDAPQVSLIVRERPLAGNGPERLVDRLGGRVGRQISIIDGFVATVPRATLPALQQSPGVHSVTPNGRVRLLNEVDGWDQGNDDGSTHVARTVLEVDDMFGNMYTGKGVDVALIDSGVVPVDGLTVPGKVVNGADLSFESQVPHLRYLDTFGHGTHLAGLIAGRDDAAPGTKHDTKWFSGIAPDARIVSVKVADAHGVADVSQVIAAIDWVVQHRRDNGLNIRVLNLSFGTDGVQDYRLDPLAYAVEVAWRKGIAVVVAAGNAGFGSKKLNNPAYDPFVIAVGAVDPNGTFDVRDDVVPPWSSSGDGARNPDFVAPGKSLVSLRSPGSHVDLSHASGRVGATPRFFRGSGTSQAAAVAAGVAALVIQARPTITPDQLKALLKMTALPIPNVDSKAQGAGRLNLAKIARNQVKTPITTQAWTPSTGAGSLDAARGSLRLVAAVGTELRGEQDIFGTPWNGAVWAPASLAETSWTDGYWNGNAWSGNAWSANAWSGNAWEANAWEANAWSGNAWEANAWEANAWSGNAWEANAWLGNAWEANAWSGNAWSSATWGE